MATTHQGLAVFLFGTNMGFRPATHRVQHQASLMTRRVAATAIVVALVLLSSKWPGALGTSSGWP